MVIDFGNGPREAVVSVETLTVYEQEFGGADLIRDFMGVQNVSEDVDADSVDFRRVNWTALVRVLWAALRTADPEVVPFREWAASVGDVNLLVVNAQLGREVVRRLFRAGAADPE